MAIKAYMAMSGREITLSPSEEKDYLEDLKKQNKLKQSQKEQFEKTKEKQREKINQILNKFEKIGVTEDDLRTLGIINVFNYK